MSVIKLKELYEMHPKEIIKILLLTKTFQDKTPEGGLALKHYRYCLVKKQDFTERTKKEMYSFFENCRADKYDLTEKLFHNMVVSGDIERCITTRHNLIKSYLNPLKEVDMLINISSEDKHPIYRINPKCLKKIDILIRKKYMIDWIKNCSDDDFETLEKESKSMRFDKYTDDYFMKINKAEPT